MKIPTTKHLKVVYRNGETGLLLTTERKLTMLSTMSLRDKGDSIIHHLGDGSGRYLISKQDHPLDIVEAIQ